MAYSSLNAGAKLNNAIRLIALVVLLGVVVYLYFLSSSEDSRELKNKIARLSIFDLVVPIALSLSSYLLRFIRWRLILRQLGHGLSLKNDLIFYLSGFALTMTPGKSGETIRSAFLLQSSVPVKTSLSAFIVERSLDLLIVGLLATLLYSPPLLTFVLFFISLAIISVIGTLLGKGKHRTLPLRLPVFLHRLLNIVSEASVVLKFKPLTGYALLGCGAWLAQGLGFYFIVRIFNQELDVLSGIGTYCTGLFIGAASMIPGGLGVTEGSLSWLLQNLGVDQNSAILSSLISRACTLWLAVAIGCIALTAIIKGQTLQHSSKILKETEAS